MLIGFATNLSWADDGWMMSAKMVKPWMWTFEMWCTSGSGQLSPRPKNHFDLCESFKKCAGWDLAIPYGLWQHSWYISLGQKLYQTNKTDYFGFDFNGASNPQASKLKITLWENGCNITRTDCQVDDDDNARGDYHLDRGLMVLQRRQVEGVGTS